MSLTKCRECQREISIEARNCPYCGAPFPGQRGWRGLGFEWRSRTTIYGYPLVHIAFGRDEQNRWRVAKGIIAIGQFGIGLITIAQFGIGIIFGFGQVILGATGIAQFAITALFGVGQFAVGYIAIGQFAAGYYALAQMGYARYLWSTASRDPQAVEFFSHLWEVLKSFLTK